MECIVYLMFNEESLAVVSASQFNPYFTRPIYDSYAFARIPDTIRSLLTGQDGAGALPPRTLAHLPRRYNKVILILIDAFGWRFLQRFVDDYPFLRRIASEGVISKLTSQFPSTTAAHVTTIHTGLPVGESGVYEWFFYEPTLDAMIAPLMFSFAGDRARNTLQRAGVHPRTLYPRRTFYQSLKDAGVRSYVFQNRLYTPSPYSDAVFDGAQTIPYQTVSEALTNLTDLVIREEALAYFFLYFDGIDALAHSYGPDSPQMAAEVDTFVTALERLLHNALEGHVTDTLLLITADHGQVEVNPETTIYLNQTMPALEGYLKTNRKGQLLVPAGSARDMFLHIRPEYLDDAFYSLTRHLDGRAEVHRVADLIREGFFGGVISETFRGRVADLVILPYRHEAVWWYEKGRFEQGFHGHHGGLTPDEMETVLLAYPYL